MDSIPWKHILGDKLAGGDGARIDLHPIVEAALVFLETNGLNTQGLFRVPGSASQVKALKETFKTKKKVPDLSDTDPNTVCSLLTDHLRSEEPLLTYALAPRWLQASGLPDLVVRLTKYVDLINQLPVANHATLFAILRLLVMISQHAEKTLMPATNLGTIFGPMICRRLNSDIAQELGDIPAVSKLCIDLITHFSQLFDYYDLDAPAGGLNVGGLGDGSVDSPRTKKTTRRKFQFGKDKGFHGDRSGERSASSAPPSAPGSSNSASPASPSSLSSLAAAPAMVASASGTSSPVLPLQSPLVLAPEYEPLVIATGGDVGVADDDDWAGTRARKNALYAGDNPYPRPEHKSEVSEGGQPRSPKARAAVSLDLEDENRSGAKIDGKSVMRSLSSMGGFYSKSVSKPPSAGETDAAQAGADLEEAEEECKDGDKKEKKRLPALNLKKRKNSIDKKKLRMFSPRKLFDKDRSKASPDSTGDLSDLERRYYDGSSSSEREDQSASKSDRKFGGRKIPFRSPRRKSSSWPEADLAELRRAQAEHDNDDSGLEDEDESDDEDDEDISSGSATPTSTSRGGSGISGRTQGGLQVKGGVAGEAHSVETAVVRGEKRKGSQSERGPSASERAAARAGKTITSARATSTSSSSSWTAHGIETGLRREREATSISPRGNDELRGAPMSARGAWVSSSPRPPNATTTNILVLKSPRIVGAAVSAAAALEDTFRSQEVVAGHLVPGEDLGLVKWKKRMTAGTARRQEAPATMSAGERDVDAVSSDDDGDERGHDNENDSGEGLETATAMTGGHAPTTGVALLLSKYYSHSQGGVARGDANGLADAGSGDTAGKPKPDTRTTTTTTTIATAATPRATNGDRQTTEREKDGAGTESEGDTENEDDVDEEGGTTTEDEGSGGNASSGEEKVKRRQENGGADKPRRRRPLRKKQSSSSGGGGNKKAAAKESSSGLKLGRKVRRGEEVGEDEDSSNSVHSSTEQLAPPTASASTPRPHSPRPRASEDHIGGKSLTID